MTDTYTKTVLLLVRLIGDADLARGLEREEGERFLHALQRVERYYGQRIRKLYAAAAPKEDDA